MHSSSQRQGRADANIEVCCGRSGVVPGIGGRGRGPAACMPHVGPIGTLPHYFENGLMSGGDPGVAFGPRPGANGTFSWANGSRLYYSNLTANFSTANPSETFKGFEAIAISRTDNPRAAAAGDASAWMNPVVISKQSKP